MDLTYSITTQDKNELRLKIGWIIRFKGHTYYKIEQQKHTKADIIREYYQQQQDSSIHTTGNTKTLLHPDLYGPTYEYFTHLIARAGNRRIFLQNFKLEHKFISPFTKHFTTQTDDPRKDKLILPLKIFNRIYTTDHIIIKTKFNAEIYTIQHERRGLPAYIRATETDTHHIIQLQNTSHICIIFHNKIGPELEIHGQIGQQLLYAEINRNKGYSTIHQATHT